MDATSQSPGPAPPYSADGPSNSPDVPPGFVAHEEREQYILEEERPDARAEVPVPRPPPPPRRRRSRRAEFNRTRLIWTTRALALIGRGMDGNHDRKALADMVFSVGFGAVQIAVISYMFVLATNTPAPANPAKNEWHAGGIIFGVLDALWIARTVGSAAISFWAWKSRLRTSRRVAIADAEAAAASAGDALGVVPGRPAPPSENLPVYGVRKLFDIFVTASWISFAYCYALVRARDGPHQAPHLFWTTISILVYSVALFPRIYFVFAVVLFMLPLTWLSLLVVNTVLRQLGHQPIRGPFESGPTIGKLPPATLARIPLVLYIPPPPSDDAAAADMEQKTASASPLDAPALPTLMPAPPKPARLRGAPARFLPLSLLSALRRGRARGRAAGGSGVDTAWEDGYGWARAQMSASTAALPLVRMESHRAACAICRTDFEPPPRQDDAPGASGAGEDAEGATVAHPDAGAGLGAAPTAAGDMCARTVTPTPGLETPGHARARMDGLAAPEPVALPCTPPLPAAVAPAPASSTSTSAPPVSAQLLALADVGEGAQPLRLLGCGHAFHKTCVDPWLTGVSGRCPTCNAAVKVSQLKRKKK